MGSPLHHLPTRATMRESGVCLIVIALCTCVSHVYGATSVQPAGTVLHYYKNTTCKYAEEFVKHQVEIVWKNDPSIAPALLRLLFSDCFVRGCDASILLDGPDSEKLAPQNLGLRGFVLIDKIKTVLEERCPGVVSCADILNLATRDALNLSGAPGYPVLTGRRDGYKSSTKLVDFPGPSITLKEGVAYFKSKGLDVLDFATLMGSHTMGATHCRFIGERLYNFNGSGKPDPNMNSSLVEELRKVCLPKRNGRHDPTIYLNPASGDSYRFTNSYYSRILTKEAILEIDQQLLFNSDTLDIVKEFAASGKNATGFEDFRRSFALSINRMGDLGVLVGNQGEIRRNCRFTNKDNPDLH